MYDIYSVRDKIAECLEQAGVAILGSGEAWSNGPQGELAIRLPNGEELYILLEELED